MQDLLPLLTQTLDANTLRTLSKKLGTDTKKSTSLLGELAPVLIGQMANNTQDSSGAESLSAALDADHDGGILSNLAGFFDQDDTSVGDGILKHVFGNTRADVEQKAAAAAGVSSDTAKHALSLLAPAIMGVLGKSKREKGLDAGGIADLLKGAQGQLSSTSVVRDALTGMLDRDNDGDIKDDVLAMGMKTITNFFSRK